ncbi:MAG: RimK/LysX family protein [Syntrophorhabdaceae bacterium]|nr:RimK/LysX family protein [Syntrophorhabdaceae bacterium]
MIVQDVFRKRRNYAPLLLIPILLVLTCIFPGLAMPVTDKPVIGAEEYVTVMPYGFTIPARVDTGAATTSLDARNMSVKGSVVTFTLPARWGGSTITLPIIDWRHIRTSKSREKRPVVEMELCIASKRLRARVNLNDRSHMRYPMIIGRNVITGNFLVDTSQSFTTLPLSEDTEADR